jgi:spermidine synthase
MPVASNQGDRQNGLRISYPLVLVCFFLSGAAGLIYEVVWARQLSLVLGITSFAHTAVITAYMAGLAAGSLYFGRWADRHPSPLRIYAWLEIGICAYAAMTPWMFDWLQSAYASLAGVGGISGMGGHLSRFTIALVALLLPTFLMGGTLPLLVRGLVHRLPELGASTGRLYGLNTLGAMTGTLLAGYLLLPQFGIVTATFTGVLINLGIGVLLLSKLSSGDASPERPLARKSELVTEENEPLCTAVRISVLLAFGMAGFAALLTQLAWIRALILVIGGSVYAFTITLASFLAGIGIGSLLYSRFLGRLRSNQQRLKTASIVAVGIAFSILLGLPLIAKLPTLFIQGFETTHSVGFPLFQLFIFSLCFSLMIVPTLFMGALFPLVTVIWTRSGDRAGQGVGTAYAVNTFGTIFGALLGGLLILPWLGVQTTVQSTATIYLIVALLFWLAAEAVQSRVRQLLPVFGLSIIFALVSLNIPAWDKLLMASGVYYRAHLTAEQVKERSLEQIAGDAELLYYREGLDGTVTVKRLDGDRYLAVNGKTDASSRGDLPTQILLGQLPLQLNRDIRDVMVIGLGSGITAGTITTNEAVEKITVLEISDEVVEASEFFNPENYRVLEHPKVEMVTADARNYLLASPETFDLIVSEPSNPWISGISNLFTAEFFRLAKSRLKPSGIMTQWFHTYSMSETDLRMILSTFSQTFTHVSIWQSLPGDLVMMGSDEAHAVELGRADWQNPEHPVTRELKRAGIDDGSDLLAHFVIGGDALRQYVSGAGLNTDKHPVIEFNAPRNLYASTGTGNMNQIYGFLNEQSIGVPVQGLFNISGSVIESSLLKLKILGNPDVLPQHFHERWLMARPRLMDEENGFTQARVAIATWKEKDTDYYLQGTSHSEVIQKSELTGMLAALVPTAASGRGEFELLAGEQGIWMAFEGTEPGSLSLGLAWTCPGSEEKTIQLGFVASFPNVQDEQRNSLLNREQNHGILC